MPFLDTFEPKFLANETSRLQMQDALRQAAEQTETTHDLMLRFFNMVSFEH